MRVQIRKRPNRTAWRARYPQERIFPCLTLHRSFKSNEIKMAKSP